MHSPHPPERPSQPACSGRRSRRPRQQIPAVVGTVDPRCVHHIINTPDDIPLAGIDAITDRGRALAAAALALDYPLSDQCVFVIVDEHRVGLGMIVVDGADHPDDIIDVATATTASIWRTGGRGVIAISVRPRTPPDTGDLERWKEVDAILADANLDLIDWLIVADDLRWMCPNAEESRRWLLADEQG